MRILYITDALAIWGGLERIIVEKVNLLKMYYGYDINLVTLNQGKHPIVYTLNSDVIYEDLGIQLHKKYRYRGIKRLCENIRLNSLFRQRMRKKIVEIEPDIIVCARIKYLHHIDKVKGNVPLVYESHTYRRASEFDKKNCLSCLKSYLYHRNEIFPQVVVTLTKGDADDWRKRNPNVCVIPNVVNLNKSGRYSDCNSKSVIFVGRFSKQKDIGTLLHVWDIVYKFHPDWFLHIFGGYDVDQENLLSEIHKKNTNIIVHDPTPNIIDKYLENSILLLTSLYEPFGLVLPEAMSCGLPVVAFDCPYGPADIITDDVDGFLIKDRNVEEYANKVCLLMDDMSLRQKMGQAGIVSSQRYTAERIMPMWKQLFEQVVEQNKK